jgi:hypothetical protein
LHCGGPAGADFYEAAGVVIAADGEFGDEVVGLMLRAVSYGEKLEYTLPFLYDYLRIPQAY